jgi:hypothetical protein
LKSIPKIPNFNVHRPPLPELPPHRVHVHALFDSPSNDLPQQITTIIETSNTV